MKTVFSVEETAVKLTQYSHGGGCGCKIAPGVLQQLITPSSPEQIFPGLMVGNETSDDAAVMEIDSERVLISTVDFFMPIVDDAFTFGQIAAANSLSDVYAMGGKPVMAVAILGWPISKLPVELAAKVMEGARNICGLAGIPVAGGHTIDSPEPFFGLSVNGIARKEHIKKNSTAQPGDILFLTKPLGVGIITTAHKRGLASETQLKEVISLMTTLNSVGEKLGKMKAVHAMTDVTGFGLLGHLHEVCRGSGISARIYKDRLPVIPAADEFAKKMIYPDSTFRTWKGVEQSVKGIDPQTLLLLCDPQTSGGLLIASAPEEAKGISALLASEGLHSDSIGEISPGEAGQISLIQKG